MDTFLTCTMVFLMLLASFNLFVGVSNDAVNFLSSALGSKSARYNIVMGVAAAGVLFRLHLLKRNDGNCEKRDF